MTRRPRMPAAERRAKRENISHHPGEKLSLKRSVATQERASKRALDHRAVSQVVTNLRRLGLLEEAPLSNSRLARTSTDPAIQATLPLGQLVSLYNSLRTPNDYDEWISKVNASLAQHTCATRCLCGRLQRMRDTLIDSAAVDNKVTPWLPNPRGQVPGSACSAER